MLIHEYMDDIILLTGDRREQQILSQCLTKGFDVKTLDKLYY